MAIEAFSLSLGPAYGGMTAIFIALFGLASVCGWFTYGAEAVKELFTNDRIAFNVYYYLYAVCSALGAVTASESVWLLSDLLTGAMLIINVFGIILLIEDIKDIITIK